MRVGEYLGEKGIKVTKSRIAVYKILSDNDSSVSADYIYDQCKAVGMDINLSTVYRTLEVFEAKQIIEKFDLGNGKYSFAIRKNKHMHKIECSECHKEIEVPCPMQQIEEILKNQTGFVLTEHRLVLKGICEQCKNKD
ncbi:transcriptional repressor [Clostridium zeae]|uniref:Transcriptional repressor n=1 Tax=Clostridium zeae TaxID=2759022 RepID=A0ABQ1EAS2_9CLOT|nr:Fur family transcriptional regulator [Clostridium zeae]GFZ31898.1 transcriptional repressor [Clostridium zeae]